MTETVFVPPDVTWKRNAFGDWVGVFLWETGKIRRHAFMPEIPGIVSKDGNKEIRVIIDRRCTPEEASFALGYINQDLWQRNLHGDPEDTETPK